VGANGSRFEAAVAAFSATPGAVAVTSGGATRDLELVPIDGP
jgi:dTDP-4-amino-4,6-dideoxygalactose transaminase